MKLVDQTNHPVDLQQPAARIISLVPSQTEYLSFLGLSNEVVGITKFCVHPTDWFSKKERIGGTKNINIDKVIQLQPDLIIANKEENRKEEIEILRQHFQVYTSDIVSINDSFQMMKDVGRLAGKESIAVQLCKSLKKDFTCLPIFSGTVLYLIWRSPYMTAGTNTFINTMLQLIGLKNAHQTNKRYDEISEKMIAELNPDFIFLSSEPYPFKQAHVFELERLTKAKVLLVDGEMFSWYGSRLQKFMPYVKKTLNSQLF
ncbi:MAG: ABC transporter substrate-binding protein [Crocinitomicaceae bacterium]